MNDIKGEEQHSVGKRYTQKTIAETFELSHSDSSDWHEKQSVFRSSELMHDTVIGLFINRSLVWLNALIAFQQV